MRKTFKVALTLALGLFAMESNAQFILKAGTNFNHATTSKEGKLTGKAGWHAGFGYNIPISGVFSIETGAYFDTRGFKLYGTDFKHTSELIEGVDKSMGQDIPYSFTTKFISEKEETDVDLNAVTIPVLARFTFPLGGDTSVFLAAGPHTNILVKGESTTLIENPTIEEFNVTDPSQEVLAGLGTIAQASPDMAAKIAQMMGMGMSQQDAISKIYKAKIQEAATPELIKQIEKGEVRDVLDEKGVNIAHMGFTLGCGVEYKKLIFEVSYQYNIADVTDFEPIQLHAFKAGLGFKF